MALRSRLFGLAAIAAIAFTPVRAPAQSIGGCSSGYTFTLGLGGSISGCFTGILSQLGEDAGLVSGQYYWAGNFGGSSGPTNAPTTAGTFMFNDDCGSTGGGTFAFCTGGFAKTPATITNTSGELVLGLQVPDLTYSSGGYWDYSGSAARNATPAPAGFQDVLLQLTLGGVDQPGQFLFGWEDLNTGCTSRLVTNNNRFRIEDLGNGPLLDSRLGTCNVITPGGNSDSDFNDSYMRFDIRAGAVTPEPVTMSLMALGLVGLGGASLRQRRKR